MTSSKRVPRSLADCAADPEVAQRLARVLESLRDLSEKMGSTAPVVQALSASLALMEDGNARAEYDELRRTIIQYLGSLDDGGVPHAATPPRWHASPDVSTKQLDELVEALVTDERGSKSD